MKQNLITDVIQGMLPYLNNAQVERLQEVLQHTLFDYEVTKTEMAIDKGMPIEQLQQLLGHRRIDTTLQYAMVKQSNVKIAHRKYIG